MPKEWKIAVQREERHIAYGFMIVTGAETKEEALELLFKDQHDPKAESDFKVTGSLALLDEALSPWIYRDDHFGPVFREMGNRTWVRERE